MDTVLKSGKPRKKGLSLKTRNNLIAYTFILPNFVGFFIFTLIPIVVALGLSFMNWDGTTAPSFAGLNNFIRMFRNETFRISLKNTVVYAIGTVPFTLVFSLAIAMLLNKGVKFAKAFRAIAFFPYVASLIAVAVVWNMLFHPKFGPVNEFLKIFGMTDLPTWTSGTKWAMAAVIIVSIWRNAGYYMVMYLAGLQGVPSELYEAATVDGANAWQRFRYITLPMLTPTTFFVVIMLTISCFKVFDLVFQMTNGGPGRATNVLVLMIYREAFENYKFGYASAISLVLFAVVLVITLVQFRMEKKWVNYM